MSDQRYAPETPQIFPLVFSLRFLRVSGFAFDFDRTRRTARISIRAVPMVVGFFWGKKTYNFWPENRLGEYLLFATGTDSSGRYIPVEWAATWFDIVRDKRNAGPGRRA